VSARPRSNGGTACTPNDPELAKLPPKVDFHLCFKTPTSYLSCQNGDNDPATRFANEAHRRGVAFKSNNTFLVSQVTMHTDHPFWDATKHDVPAHCDQFAARAKPGVGGANALVSLEPLRSSPTGRPPARGNARCRVIRGRSCGAPGQGQRPVLRLLVIAAREDELEELQRRGST
jgi:hypothetical protein